MRTEHQNTVVTVYYGDQPAHKHERRAINRIRLELERRGVVATMLVNFTVANGSQQIDLFVLTAGRCMNVELKTLPSDLAVVASANGFWHQRMPDGHERALDDRNYYTQARDQTYGLSDTMARLSRDGLVPAPRQAKFFRDIDTVVCIDPVIPANSTLAKFHHVAVIGLDQLVDRLLRGGPGLPDWTPQHWDVLIRHLSLYQEGDDSAAAVRRRANDAAVDDYRRHFTELTGAGLDPMITPTSVVDGHSVQFGVAEMSMQLTEGRRVVLLGASGNGKTHLARHTARHLTSSGHLVLYLAADDYEKDRLGRALARAVGPYSTERADALMVTAAENGAVLTVIVDALDKCLHRQDLVRQLHALQRQFPACAILVTAADGTDTEDLIPSTTVQLVDPTIDERAQLAGTHGATGDIVHSEEFRTRYDLVLAAQVVKQAGAGITNTGVLDQYVRRLTPTEAVRAGLRRLAHAMDAGVRTALPLSEAAVLLSRWCNAHGLPPTVIDAVLASRLVSIRQSRLRFDHEKLARFLTAEQLVLDAADGTALARHLKEPTHHDLHEHALELETDTTRRYDALRGLADPTLIAAAVRGRFGVATAKNSRADVSETLVSAAAAVSMTTFTAGDEQQLIGSWNGVASWTAIDHALLSAAGICLRTGVFLHEVAALLDATDDAMHNAMTQLIADGHRAAITTVIGSTLAFTSRNAMAAAIVVHALEGSRVFDVSDFDAVVPTATPMWREHPRSHARIYVAAVLSQPPLHPEDAENLPDLVRIGLRAGGYHLRLELLQAAQFGCRILNPVAQQRMIEVLNAYEPPEGDLGTSSVYLEALASYDEITPAMNADDIRTSIEMVISEPTNSLHRRTAYGVVASQFEDERLLGPYSEVIDTLPKDTRLTLFAMAAFGADDGFALPHIMKTLANEGIGSGIDAVGKALERGAAAVSEDGAFLDEAVETHLAALHGWSKLTATLPQGPRAAADEQRALVWRLVDELLLFAFRGESNQHRAEEIWNQLTRLPGPTATVLCDIHFAQYVGVQDDTVDLHDALIATYPEQIRMVLEFTLTHGGDHSAARTRHRVRDLSAYCIQILADVGTAETGDLLRHHYVHDPGLGGLAVTTVRAIDSRANDG